MKFMFSLQHPLTCKLWVTLFKPCNKVRGKILLKKSSCVLHACVLSSCVFVLASVLILCRCDAEWWCRWLYNTYTCTHINIYAHTHANTHIYIYIYIWGSLNKFQTFFLWALLLIVHTWNSSPLRSNLLRLQWTCCTIPTTSARPHGSPLVSVCQWPSSQPLSSPQLSHNDSLWA